MGRFLLFGRARSLGSIAALLFVFGTAGTAATQPLFNVNYYASSGQLPDASCPPWLLIDTATPENPTNNGSALVINTSVGTENMLFRQLGASLSMPSLLIIECRAKFISGSSNNAARAPMCVSVTRSASVGTSLFIANGEIFLTAAGALVKGPTAAVATSDAFHTYRLEVASSGVVRVFYDNVLKLSGATYTNSSDFGPDPSIFFGEAASGAFGQSEWQYFKHNASAVPCAPTPGINFTSVYDASQGGMPVGGCQPWTAIDTAAPEDPTSSGGKLVISTSDLLENIAFTQALDQIPNPFVAEFRAKLISGSSNSAIRSPMGLAVTTAPQQGVLFFVANGEIFLTAAGPAGTVIKGAAAAVATIDDFHTYRIEITTDGVVTVFYDDALALTGHTYTSLGDHGPTPRVYWGEGSVGAQGSSEWLSVRHNGVLDIADQTPPELTVPADVAVTTGPGTEACADVRLSLEVGTALATDNCSEPVVSVSGMPDGGLFPVGESILTWTATDAAGNSVSNTQRVFVACPVGDIAGSALLQCNSQSSPAGDVTVRLLHEGIPFRETTTDPAGEYRFAEVRYGTYTVAIDAKPGFATAPDTRLVALDGTELIVDPFVFTCLLSDLSGQVVATCNAQTAGIQGVTVDLFREDELGMDVLVATTPTDEQGNFGFDQLALGEYTVGIVTPLGYAADGAASSVVLDTPGGALGLPPIALTCQAIAAQPRNSGYWKHQVNVYLTGKGHAQESLANLLGYIDAMVSHFNENLINPVIVYTPISENTQDKLNQIKQLFTVNRGETHNDRAKQELLSLLLNVVSAKISQTTVISSDGATVSQAITFVAALITDADPHNDNTAKRICELINDGKSVSAGEIPQATPVIAYRNPLRAPGGSGALQLGPVSPNPMGGTSGTVELVLPAPSAAILDLVDAAGRVHWRKLVTGPGRSVVRVGEGVSFQNGVYFLRLMQDGERITRKFVVIR